MEVSKKLVTASHLNFLLLMSNRPLNAVLIHGTQPRGGGSHRQLLDASLCSTISLLQLTGHGRKRRNDKIPLIMNNNNNNAESENKKKYASSWKVAVSIPDEVIEYLQCT
jgi:DNA polymerase III epsilon subunit-like protein